MSNDKTEIQTFRELYPSYNDLNDSDFIKKVVSDDPHGSFKERGIDADSLAKKLKVEIPSNNIFDSVKAFGAGAIDNINDAYFNLNNRFAGLKKRPDYMSPIGDTENPKAYSYGQFAGGVIPYIATGSMLEKGVAKGLSKLAEQSPKLAPYLSSKLLKNSLVGAGTGYLTAKDDDVLRDTALFGVLPSVFAGASKGIEYGSGLVRQNVKDYLTQQYLKKGLTGKINDAIKYGSEDEKKSIGGEISGLDNSIKNENIPFNYKNEYIKSLLNTLQNVNKKQGGQALTSLIKDPSNQVIKNSFLDEPNNLHEAIVVYRGLNSNIKDYFSNNILNTLSRQQRGLLNNTISSIKGNLRDYIGKSLNDSGRDDLFELFNTLNEKYAKNRTDAKFLSKFNPKLKTSELSENDIDWDSFLRKAESMQNSNPRLAEQLIGNKNLYKSRLLSELKSKPITPFQPVNELIDNYKLVGAPVKWVKNLPFAGISSLIPEEKKRKIIADALINSRK